jgi:hypothetical protein
MPATAWLLFATWLGATTPPEPAVLRETVCWVLADPAAYHGKTVEVHAQIVSDGRHYVQLRDEGCRGTELPVRAHASHANDPEISRVITLAYSRAIRRSDEPVTATFTGVVRYQAPELTLELIKVADIVSTPRGALSIYEVLLEAETLDGHTVTVEAEIRDPGGHTMFLVDVDDAGKRLDLHIERDIASSDAVLEMTGMLVEDRSRESPLGVVADLTGTFFSKPDGPALLASNIENLRWREQSATEPEWQCRVDTDPGVFENTILPGVTVTRRLAGTVLPSEGDWQEVEAPSLSIWRHPNGELQRVRVGKDGTIDDVSLEPGRYCYLVSARGFSNATGRLEIRERAPVRPVEVRIGVSN